MSSDYPSSIALTDLKALMSWQMAVIRSFSVVKVTSFVCVNDKMFIN